MGSAGSSKASFEVIACSMPGIEGFEGPPPVATRMFCAVTRRSPIATVCASSSFAVPSIMVTPTLANPSVYTAESRAISRFLFAISAGQENDAPSMLQP